MEKSVSRRISCFTFYSEGKKLRLPIKQIIYAEILNHDLYITTNGWGNYSQPHDIKSHFLEKMPDNFIRIHHSYVINTDFLMGVGYRECTVAGNVVLPVARGCRKRLRSILCRKERRGWYEKTIKSIAAVTVFFMILAILGILQSIPGADWEQKRKPQAIQATIGIGVRGLLMTTTCVSMAAGSRHRQNFYMKQMLTEVPVLIRIVI